MTQQTLHKLIDQASNVVGKTWPLYSFVTSNPLSGYEAMPFETAVDHATTYLGANVYPSISTYIRALKNGDIDHDVLKAILVEHYYTETPDYYLNLLNTEDKVLYTNEYHELDRIMAKWLSVFMDEGLAEWSIPNKNLGFFKAWKQLSRYDKDTKVIFKNEIPNTSEETLRTVLFSYSVEEITEIFNHHLAALPGWVGYIKYRSENNTLWHKEFPISLMDYLAVRLWVAKNLNIDFTPKKPRASKNKKFNELKALFLKAWETSWQQKLVETINSKNDYKNPIEHTKPDAQMVFCIDTRSELIRRHIENKGNYETFGYAGFFGIATDYEDLETGIVRKSCPPILPSAYITSEGCDTHNSETLEEFKNQAQIKSFRKYLLRRLKNMLPSAFGFVEGTGIFYGISMVMRTLLPTKNIKLNREVHVEDICQPQINSATDKSLGISLKEKVAIVKSAFDLLGWNTFAPLVVFTGHGSHTANNPFASSLDCGACAASPGRHNARLLAKLANDSNVRQSLNKEYGIRIPEETIFIGAEHNTTTDAITLFDTNIPNTQKEKIETLKLDLRRAQQTAAQERLILDSDAVKEAIKKSENWSEIRPEWGLAKNAGFIIGSRTLTKNSNLHSRCFLHSYDWQQDTEGKALEAIMQGPMVVTQWINNHYYFSTVDNDNLGGGNKINHNVIGKFGVLQGNGGDLKFGLPLQSVNATDDENYHDPLRLSVVIHAPIERVSNILLNNNHLKRLLDNHWIYLLVMDPKDKNRFYKYHKNLNWSSLENNLQGEIKAKNFQKIETLEEAMA